MAKLNIKMRGWGWDVARWYSACLACTRPWDRSQYQKRKDKRKKDEGLFCSNLFLNTVQTLKLRALTRQSLKNYPWFLKPGSK
jgi:hypothetical protein